MAHDEATESQSTGAETGIAVAAQQEKLAREVFPLLTDLVTPASVPLFVENLRRGAKPRSEWMCGVELELFGYDTRRDYARLNPVQVQRVLAGFAPSSSDLVYEENVLIEVNAGQMNRLTVEPGGQVEFSGAPQRNLKDVERELRRYLARLHEIAEAEGLAFLAVGFDPLRTIEEQNWFPKGRYEIMRPYLATRGARAWDMMTRTCAAQASLDYGSVEDLAKKFLLGNRLAPIITAIFANSPFENGRPSGYKSTRAAAWLATDNDRTGIPSPALTDDFTPESFVAYALDVPMIFAQRDGHYLDAPTGMKFGDFLAHGCDSVQPTFGDWADHLTTLFTDARLKQHIELRSADCGNLQMTLALQALWKGLLYDDATLDEALRLAPRLNHTDSLALRERVARDALDAKHAGVNVLALAQEIVTLAVNGLQTVALDEVSYLDVLRQQVVEDGISPADILLHNWRGSLNGSISYVVEHLRIA
ncbi:MAG: glutamate--cysteine ligase [Acidobacteriota bacterium]|jgi:glutamate--cysteine ligase|nr:glutamate--cysteine ligase [Acidobacteriota bacterium]